MLGVVHEEELRLAGAEERQLERLLPAAAPGGHVERREAEVEEGVAVRALAHLLADAPLVPERVAVEEHAVQVLWG